MFSALNTNGSPSEHLAVGADGVLTELAGLEGVALLALDVTVDQRVARCTPPGSRGRPGFHSANSVTVPFLTYSRIWFGVPSPVSATLPLYCESDR